MSNFKIFLISFIVGGLFFTLFYININDDVVKLIAKSDTGYAFQVGVFSDYDNAFALSKEYDGVIIKDEELYRVYIAIVRNSELLEVYKKYYRDVNYHLKSIVLSDAFITELDDYEKVLLVSSDSVYEEINKQILKTYGELDGKS